MTKLLLLNLPSGPVPTDYPPVAISRVIEGLEPELGCEAVFLNLDLLRPSFGDLKEKIRAFGPQVIGFSAILTPSYKYLKELSLFLRREFPGIVQVMGGEMCVIRDLVLRKSAVDFCVVGQAEPAFSSLIKTLEERGFNASDKAPFRAIKGLAYLNAGAPFFTGEETHPDPVRQINYALLSKFTDLGHYIHGVAGPYYRNRINPDEIGDFYGLLKQENLPKNLVTVFASKGCVGRCTFCHRYFKGYKVMDTAGVIESIKTITAERNAGMLQFQEEDFGSDRAATVKLTAFLKESGLNWAATAVRARSVNDELMKSWREAGCAHINFGIESGSQKILDVMEKLTTVGENLNALRLCNKYRVATIISLVIGMPGETEATIDETIDNLASALPDDVTLPYEVSINFFQAVPGTEGYKFAQAAGLIPSDPAGEEKYIENLHEAGAAEIDQYLNFTDYEKEEVLYWKDYIQLELLAAYLKKNGRARTLEHKKSRRFRRAAVYALLPRPLRRFLLKYFIILRHYGPGGLLSLLSRKLFNPRPQKYSGVDRSLRLINAERGRS
ncbi:MAG: hypothetical protein A2X32_08190 [Elusimicrobia bacterium GWC2_64_44]|nr:MAG: hypothetical protein A2X32_08190 [Elusimicrobia bacterium GWC2_64_44]